VAGIKTIGGEVAVEAKFRIFAIAFRYLAPGLFRVPPPGKVISMLLKLIRRGRVRVVPVIEMPHSVAGEDARMFSS